MKLLSLLIMSGLTGLLLMVGSVSADDILTGNGNGVDCSGKAKTSAICAGGANNSDANPLTGCEKDGTGCGTGVLDDAINVISFIAGAAAVIIMIIGALQFATSGSDLSTNSRTDTDVENARRTIGGAVIGLLVIILARFIILFVVNRVAS
ncbi:MAG TPA: hypothetical protein VG604_03610 [Candidatus Saccharimonadales bacterium]|nr:hypothetical protein [Candidatus Saccharimonadales bacterium]